MVRHQIKGINRVYIVLIVKKIAGLLINVMHSGVVPVNLCEIEQEAVFVEVVSIILFALLIHTLITSGMACRFKVTG